MQQKISFYLALFVIAAGLITSLVSFGSEFVQAQSPAPSATAAASATGCVAPASKVSFGNNIQCYVTEFYKWSIGAGIALAIIMLVYAGYTMIVSVGDPAKVGFAKEVIVGSLTGLAFLAGARLVLNILKVG